MHSLCITICLKLNCNTYATFLFLASTFSSVSPFLFFSKFNNLFGTEFCLKQYTILAGTLFVRGFVHFISIQLSSKCRLHTLA